MALTPEQFQRLLGKAKLISQQKKDEDTVAAISSLEEMVDKRKPDSVDLSMAGITPTTLQSAEGRETAVDVIREIAAVPSVSPTVAPSAVPATPTTTPTTTASTASTASKTETKTETKKDAGVARDVSLNKKQQQFIDTAIEGEDICLIGAAGTGKTTVVGKFIRKLSDAGTLRPLSIETKWLRPETPGILITSFTRKAVNNIRRAVPEELKPHVLTIHKVLEFGPIFYEVEDPKDPTRMKTTMKFEPQRTAYNPLPSTLTLVIYEESSMIGTDLYNLMSAAMPHAPQEIFIGDIRQLPPIFGPAILGFKMSLLPVVELNEVYRQALLSPIIRLAHAILSGDSTKFSAKVEMRKEKHPHLDQVMERKYVPSLEKFNEKGEHGSVKLQIWQKKLQDELACSTTVQQFAAWEKSGYYNPNDDLILCPFNKSFGTIELNKGISQYLGKKRSAVVHEVIAGFNKHYLAIGDRVLFDKEDAFITDIRRNVNYMGKSPASPSMHLDRWGTYQEELSKEEQKQADEEDAEFSTAAIDKFMESFSEDEERTTVASHAIYIKFAYSEETITLSSAGEVNAILGGYAITVHKAQGSEAEAVFLVLHHSHAVMINNELLYTAVTRARQRLHIICETDTFFKGVKTQKVRGVTLQEKIDFFKGKVEFKEMQKETEFLLRQREVKKLRLQAEKAALEKASRKTAIEFEPPIHVEDFPTSWELQEYKEQHQQKEDSNDEPRMEDIYDTSSVSIGSPGSRTVVPNMEREEVSRKNETEVGRKQEIERIQPQDNYKLKLLQKLKELRR